MFLPLALATLGAAHAGTFSESATYGSFLVPLDGSDVTLSVTLDVADLDPYVGGRLEVQDAILDLTFWDLDIDPDITVVDLGGGCLCNITLIEYGEVTADGLTVGSLTDGADNDYATTSFDLDTDALLALETDGTLELEVNLWADFNNPCGTTVGNAMEYLTDVTVSGNFDDNHAPTPSAAVKDADADASCVASVTLDGSASSDLDSTAGTNDDIVSFEWDVDSDGATDFTGDIVSAPLGVGEHDVTLTVTDSYGESSSETVTITVHETAATYEATVTPDVLSPADHIMWDIDYDLAGTWDCSGDAVEDTVWALVNVTSNEADDAPGSHDGATTGDIDLQATGDLDLRAERSWRGSGRVYTLEFEVYGDGGAVTDTATGEVTVPLSSHGCSAQGAAGSTGLLVGMLSLMGLALRRRED
jgi:MYXO-CTERM domain-containing protein